MEEVILAQTEAGREGVGMEVETGAAVRAAVREAKAKEAETVAAETVEGKTVAERVEETMVVAREVAMAGAARVVEMGEGAKAAG